MLETTDFETYSIVKDKESGQHYLRYSFFHIQVSAGGTRFDYEQFLPLEADDVLGLVFGEQPYRFPDHWRSVYYRSGTDGRLMLFDPSENHDLEKAAAAERDMLEKLLEYKQRWQAAEQREELTKQLFADLDEIMKKTDDK
nr:hypothetical protein [Brevibacillus fulvus]